MLLLWGVKQLKDTMKAYKIDYRGLLEKQEMVDKLLSEVKQSKMCGTITLSFMGHYYEPDYSRVITLEEVASKVYVLDYDVTTRSWELAKAQP